MSPVSPVARREAPLGRQVCLAVVLAAGLNIVWGLGLVWTIAVINTMTQPKEPWSQILIAADGSPVRVLQAGDGTARDYTTLDGKPYGASETTPFLLGAALSIESTQTPLNVTRPVAPHVGGFTDGRRAPVDWYFVLFRKSPQTGYFVGYDRVSQRRVGYLGRAGFTVAEPNADQSFEINRAIESGGEATGLIAPPGVTGGTTAAQYSFQVFSQEPPPGKIPGAVLHLCTGDRVFRIDLRARSVETVLEASGLLDIAILHRRRETAPAANPHFDDALAVRGKGTVLVLDNGGRSETLYRLPAGIADRSFTFFQMADRTALALVSRDDPQTQMTYTDLVWFTKDGTVLRRVDGALAVAGSWISTKSLGLAVAFAFPAPLGPLAATTSFVLSGASPSPAPTLHRAILNELPSIVPAEIISLVLMAVAFWLYMLRTARYGERRRVAWLVLIGLWGLPGYFGYVLQRRWPAKVACETCGVPAPRDRDVCFHCGEQFPMPLPNGLEIFA